MARTRLLFPLRRLFVASAATSAAAAAAASPLGNRFAVVPAFFGPTTSASGRQRRNAAQRSINPFATKSTAPIMAATTESSETADSRGLYLFDFDGVICDSCDECTIAALRTVRSLGVLDDDDEEVLLLDEKAILDGGGDSPPPKWLLDEMRAIRPAIEVGWQIPVMLAVLLDQKKKKKGDDDDGGSGSGDGDGDGGMTTEEVITNYESLVSATLERWGKTDAEMIAAFGGVRDAWMAEDLPSWLEANTFYAGIPEGLVAVSACGGGGSEVAVVTTKQQRFAVALMRHAGVGEKELPDEDIYGLGMYKAKSDVIVDRMKGGQFSPEETHFFEDRWPTLAKCLKDERLQGVKLYLCDWGYVAPHERELARAEERVTILPLDQFGAAVAPKK